MTGGALAGKRIFVAEDEAMVLMLFEDTLSDIGCEVAGTASSLQEAIDKVGMLDFDIGLLDMNLSGQRSFAVADELLRKRIPFVFATGYGASGIPEAYRSVPTVHKPFSQRDLESALASAIARAAQ
jgi:CheY-like chemotaxis protein